MNKKELFRQIKKAKAEEVLVRIKGGLYYPISFVTNEDGQVIIYCDDIEKRSH